MLGSLLSGLMQNDLGPEMPLLERSGIPHKDHDIYDCFEAV